MRILYLRALSALLLFSFALLPFQGANAQSEEAGSEIEKGSYFRPGIAPVSAPPDYDLTIVYFMDYQCPACRQYTPDVARVLAEDRKVRMIYRDTPIISDLSTVAARAAIASAFQGRHAAFHHALMTSKGRLSEAAIRAAADKAKVDWPRLQRDLKSRGEAIDDQIGRNVELAVTIGVLGTPAFIVGERQSNGALDYKGLKAEIADARAALAKSGAGAGASPAKPAASGEAVPASGTETARAEDAGAAEQVRSASPAAKSAPLFNPSAPRPSAAIDDDRAKVPRADWLWLSAVAVLAMGGAGAWFWRLRGQRRATAKRR